MKTSKQERIQEYRVLEWQASNGMMLHKEDIRRHQELRKQLFPKRRDNAAIQNLQ